MKEENRDKGDTASLGLLTLTLELVKSVPGYN